MATYVLQNYLWNWHLEEIHYYFLGKLPLLLLSANVLENRSPFPDLSRILFSIQRLYWIPVFSLHTLDFRPHYCRRSIELIVEQKSSQGVFLLVLFVCLLFCCCLCFVGFVSFFLSLLVFVCCRFLFAFLLLLFLVCFNDEYSMRKFKSDRSKFFK